MSEILQQLVLFFEELVLTIGYPGIFLVMFAENLIPPIPTDPLLPLAGLLVAEGEMEFLLVWFAAVAGAMSGSLVLYSIGAWADDKVVRRLIDRWGKYIGVDEAGLDRAFALFDRYGAPILIVGRSIPLIRVAVTLVAGMSRMALHKYLFYASLQSFAATAVYIGAGYLVGENWREVVNFVRVSPLVAAIIGGVLLAMIGFWWWRRRKRRENGDPITNALLDTQEVRRTPEPEM